MAHAPKPVRLSQEHVLLLFDFADRRRRSLVSLDDFVVFHRVLARPDAEYQLAYRMFDPEGTGRIEMERFRQLLRSGLRADSPPFNPDCSWLSLYNHAGKQGEGRQWWTYAEFAQLLRGLPGERLRQAFHHYDPEHTGYITPEAFRDMVSSLARHRLSAYVLNHLTTLCSDTVATSAETTTGLVNYATVRAFYNVVRQLDSVDTVIRTAARNTADHRVDRMDFTDAAAQLGRSSMFSPLEVNVIFHFIKLEHPETSRFRPEDFRLLLDPSWTMPRSELAAVEVQDGETAKKPSRMAAFGLEAFKQAYSFGLGAIGGAVGATVVYPIDLVKTRMQNQRSAVVGELLYKNSMDCFRKVIRNEGVLGLYSGLGPQLVGVAPEKAIKLVMNDIVRAACRDPRTGELKIWHEVLAGCVAGGSQVVFTNPLEIVKIRLQVQGEMAKVANVPQRSAVWIVRELGLLGLYKGAGACLLRDIPFSGIYFTAYSHLKTDLFHEGQNGKRLNIWELLSAGAIAGMPAAYLTTPADVIKTRLQVEVRQGQTQYHGIMDAFRKIRREEGMRAFFKGGPARVLRSSPQFGTTLMVYELLQNWMPFSRIESSLGLGTAGAEAKRERERTSIDRVADAGLWRTRRALRLLQDLDFRFGMLSPSVAGAKQA
ncbi:mitochondrial carrier domain-containing protein [Thamnocephalis sphaerospora]|uniref:Mitochondrial aspartate-glutamate transporter AGC1 n=1 Tax=Thamnocephalis sphaerospora TaxID=78915 RepID=A0A4V1IW72_9FUNG|nr:mitochondrial carrier domain-containing protein [Thamnocephalis sphaerospora]|eukprot:RKP06549.1 mitochondrial carrier domain-containing protein [Thamnocephalis sphaerospora]